jgi:hypothetical protein
VRLEIATYKAIKYACLNYHYAKRVPSGLNIGFSVFNENNEFCGVIIYGYPASPNLLPNLNLKNGHLLELRRVALNSKQGITSKVLSISMKLIKKKCPLVKILISYSDKGQNHYGIIYQATNWNYLGESESSGVEYLINNKWVHSRHGKGNIKRKLAGKRKYVYVLDKSLTETIKKISKEYPKQHAVVV